MHIEDGPQENTPLKKWETPILTNLSLGSDDVEFGAGPGGEGGTLQSS